VNFDNQNSEESIINSLYAKETVSGKGIVKEESLPVEKTIEILKKYDWIK